MGDQAGKKFRTRCKTAVLRYLDFAEGHADLAEEIAQDAVSHICGSGGACPARIAALPLERQAALAAHACIRHSYTDYDDILIEKTIEQSDPLFEDGQPGSGPKPVNAVAEFLRLHRGRERAL